MNPLQAYADSYRLMGRTGDGQVMCSSVAVDIERNMAPHAVTSEQLEGLRALRLHHWKGARKFKEHIERLESRNLEGLRQTQLDRLGESVCNAKSVHLYQMKQVNFLNTFFPIGDTAERDNDNATNL